MSEHNDFRLLELHSAGAWLFIEDVQSIKKIKFFAGKQTADGSLSVLHYVNIDDMRAYAHQMLTESEFVIRDYKGDAKSKTSYMMKLESADNDGLTVVVTSGPGNESQNGLIVPDKSQKHEFVIFNADAHQKRKLATFMRDYCFGIAVTLASMLQPMV